MASAIFEKLVGYHLNWNTTYLTEATAPGIFFERLGSNRETNWGAIRYKEGEEAEPTSTNGCRFN